ncbi:MAG: BNR-4 repeat-containing protein [Verrucomicrobia bacterium]|nr:BNR-4 repeat-containing protein [Verrucomicrobiota bacterium]
MALVGTTSETVFAGAGELPVPAYSSSCINTGIFRRNALITIGSIQVISYFASDGRIAILCRSVKTGQFNEALFLDSKMSGRMIGDGHQAVNIGYSADGYVHVIWGCHDTKDPKYTKLRWPDLNIVSEGLVSRDIDVSRLSYPQFYGTPMDLKLLFRRDSAEGADNPYDQCIWRYDEEGGAWSSLQNPLITFPPAPQLAYMNGMGESGDTIAIAYTIRRYDIMDVSDVHMRVK